MHLDYGRKPELKRLYRKLLISYLDDFKAKTRQYAKRQNIWFRREADFVWIDVMGGDSGPKRLHAVVNKMVDCLKLDRTSLKQNLLASDEQAKLRAVNADPECQKALK